MAHDPLPVANPSIVFREEFDDWALLFDPDTSESYGINCRCLCLETPETVKGINAVFPTR